MLLIFSYGLVSPSQKPIDALAGQANATGEPIVYAQGALGFCRQLWILQFHVLVEEGHFKAS
jgi:hypothetical protein